MVYTLMLVVFVLGYAAIAFEHQLKIDKAAAALVTGVVTWTLYVLSSHHVHEVEGELLHHLSEISSILFFLIGAMTIVELVDAHEGFSVITDKIKTTNKVKLMWIICILSFFFSAALDNLTTSIVMVSLLRKLIADQKDRWFFAGMVVVAANAGGAFSPFGDITTLMVWQKGLVDFQQFFVLFLPSAVNYLIPAGIMHFAIKNEKPKAIDEKVNIKTGGILITILFLLTIATAVSFHNFLHLPPAMGMMTGLGYLMVVSYFIKRQNPSENKSEKFDIFTMVSRAEWDTLLFFFGVIVSVGGLGFMGYLALVSEAMYVQLGATYANVLVGILSAIVDNIPVMFAVLTMTPDMSLGQWLLVTLTAGVGGSLLSIGSAAGVALMGQSKGYYTFVSHLKWIWAIALGYAASILVHLWINSALFDVPI